MTDKIIVIGAGPAGSSTAAILAEKGHDVTIIEKDLFPRYHVGESLMPYCYFPLERLGLIDWISNSHFPQKHSVQFVRANGMMSQPFYFFQHFDHKAATTWQVVRSEFDQKLLDNAIEKGAKFMAETKAIGVIEENGIINGVRVVNADGEFDIKTKMVVDATGKDALTINQFKERIPDPILKKVAIWTYYKGAKRDPGLDEGATTVAYLPEKAWFWYIPLPDDRVSVGIVSDTEYVYRNTKNLKDIFENEIQNNEWIKDHLSTGTVDAPYYVTSDFSYKSKFIAKEGLVLVGDAYSFLDPVFSSGVFLALTSGVMAGDHIDKALRENNISPDQFQSYQEEFEHGLNSMKQLVYAFYDTTFSFGKLMKKYPELRGDLTDCLIGNMEQDFTKLFSAVSEFAEVTV